MNQKGSSLIYVLLLILLVTGGLGYYILNNQSQFNPTLPNGNSQSVIIAKKTPSASPSAFPTMDTSNLSKIDTSNWKTYTNQKFGISLKYPNTLKIPTKNADDNEIVGFLPVNAADNISPVIDIRILDNPNNLSIQAYNEQYKDSANPSLVWDDLSKAKVTTVGGKQAYFLELSQCDPELCDRYLIPLQNKIIEVYRLSGVYNVILETESVPIFNGIISSLKFSN